MLGELSGKIKIVSIIVFSVGNLQLSVGNLELRAPYGLNPRRRCRRVNVSTFQTRSKLLTHTVVWQIKTGRYIKFPGNLFHCPLGYDGFLRSAKDRRASGTYHSVFKVHLHREPQKKNVPFYSAL